MFASPSYWIRLLGALLFLFSITVDGVDGELARLTMSETKFGGNLDLITDNIVHVAIFAGIFWGCYRMSGVLPTYTLSRSRWAASRYAESAPMWP